MTFVRFAREDESVSFGLLAGDEIQPIGGSPFGSWSEEGTPVALSAVRLLAPVEPSKGCLLYTSPSPRDGLLSRMPSSA